MNYFNWRTEIQTRYYSLTGRQLSQDDSDLEAGLLNLYKANKSPKDAVSFTLNYERNYINRLQGGKDAIMSTEDDRDRPVDLDKKDDYYFSYFQNAEMIYFNFSKARAKSLISSILKVRQSICNNLKINTNIYVIDSLSFWLFNSTCKYTLQNSGEITSEIYKLLYTDAISEEIQPYQHLFNEVASNQRLPGPLYWVATQVLKEVENSIGRHIYVETSKFANNLIRIQKHYHSTILNIAISPDDSTGTNDFVDSLYEIVRAIIEMNIASVKSVIDSAQLKMNQIERLSRELMIYFFYMFDTRIKNTISENGQNITQGLLTVYLGISAEEDGWDENDKVNYVSILNERTAEYFNLFDSNPQSYFLKIGKRILEIVDDSRSRDIFLLTIVTTVLVSYVRYIEDLVRIMFPNVNWG